MLPTDFGVRDGPLGAVLHAESRGEEEEEEVVFALADEPDRQRQVPAGWRLSDGNLGLFGMTGSGTSTAVRSLTVLCSTRISVRTPAHASGAVDLTVTTPAGTSRMVSAARYTYVAAPTVASVSLRSGSRRGGQVVTILGAGFTGATSVRFGRTVGRSMRVLSSTKITLRAPAHPRGRVDVTVTTPGGRSRLSTRDRYRFI